MNAQPMETAPRDGTHILAANLNQANPIWTAVHWFDERWYLSVNELELHAGWQCDRLTHWLPQPPTKIIDFPSSECRPNPETQAVAPIELFMCEIPRLTLKPGHPYIFGVDPECPKCAEYLSGSPVESVPVSALRELEAEHRSQAADGYRQADMQPQGSRMNLDMKMKAAVHLWSADRLSAVIRRTKT